MLVIKIFSILFSTLFISAIFLVQYSPKTIDNLQKWYETKFLPYMNKDVPQWLSNATWIIWFIIVLCVSLFSNLWD